MLRPDLDTFVKGRCWFNKYSNKSLSLYPFEELGELSGGAPRPSIVAALAFVDERRLRPPFL